MRALLPRRSRAASGRRRALAALGLVLAALAVATSLFSCSQTPTSVPIRTFERAQRVDVLCLRVRGPGAPEPLPQEECAPVPPNVNGGNLDNQLFALVTQTARGEVAVVDLSAGLIIDQSQGVPGQNFLSVGAIPTDIAATPDGRMAFVASAEPNKFAIYGIPGHRILGDFAGRDPEGAATLASWPVCGLPQRPGALTIVPRRAAPSLPDAGADASSDAAAADAGDGGVVTTAPPPYELVAVLPGDRVNSAKVITIDPRPFLRGAPRRDSAGRPIDSGDGVGPVLTPGQIAPCPITSAVELSGGAAIPDSFRAGAHWEDGVRYADGGVDLSCEGPEKLARCGLRPCRCTTPTVDPVDAGGDAATDAAAPDLTCDPDAAAPSAPVLPLDLPPLDPPQPVTIARDDQTIYIADDGVPLIHVVDLSTAGAPVELPPFVVTSLVDPSRAVSIREIAISPPTRDYKRYLYAVDRKEGSIAIFDVTDPRNAERTPMRRPHPELNPFQPPDRIAFAAPVVAVAFARHDLPLARVKGLKVVNGPAGLLCNPSPNLDPTATPSDLGAFYRDNSTDPEIALGPSRLRGIFAFATLSNGQIVAIDVDDWDAPCRRPLNLVGRSAADDAIALNVGSLAVAQPVPAAGDIDPYHAPFAPPGSVTQEVFFPVTAPHRLRSAFLLRDDSRSGKHIPFLPSAPSIQSTGAPLPLFGQGSESTPRIRPTAVREGLSAGTEDIGIRFSVDVPDVHFDQDWTVTYEGTLPGFEGLPATLATTDAYASLVLSQPQARFCAKGVEDWAASGERANAITNALARSGRPIHGERLDRRMTDYVQVADDLLGPDDAYWSQADLPEPNSCWDKLVDQNGQPVRPGRERYDACARHFSTPAEQSSNRDFPILEAYEDRLVVGRFAKIGGNKTREVIYTDPSNAPYLKLLRCCFHNQIKFNVRTASQWVSVGSTVGLLSHMTRGEGGRCVSSCEPREALLNARAPSLPFGAGDFAPFRDSPLAMRNPSFSFFIQNGQKNGQDVVPVIDTSWRFQTRGQFQPLVINLAASTTAVNPQSMRFIETLGQIAVVDGAAQGLVLIDLKTVSIARAPYF